MCYHFYVIFFLLATIVNLIIAFNVSACCAGHYRHTNKFIIVHFMTELSQKDLIESVYFA